MKVILDSSACPSLPYPKPFSGATITQEALEAFIKKTLLENKQPIVIFGANWCPDARFLEGVIRLPVVKDFLERNANIFNIDVGEYEINTALFRMFEPGIVDGIPRVFILDRKSRCYKIFVFRYTGFVNSLLRDLIVLFRLVLFSHLFVIFFIA